MPFPWTYVVNGLLPAEGTDLSKIANRAPSVARMLLDQVAATPDAEAADIPDTTPGSA